MKKIFISLLFLVTMAVHAEHHWETLQKGVSSGDLQIDTMSVEPDRPAHLHLWDRHYDVKSGKTLSLEQVDVLCNRRIVRVNYSMDYIKNKEETYLDPFNIFPGSQYKTMADKYCPK